MADPLCERQRFRQLAKNGQVIEIAKEIADFDRLSESIDKDLSTLDDSDRPENWRGNWVRGQIRFGYLDRGDAVPVLDARLTWQLPAVCQRCLRAFELPLETTFGLALVQMGDSGKDSNPAPAGYELWELSDKKVRPIDIIDEALVMALPMAPKHIDQDECLVVESDLIDRNTLTPFAGLRAQMDDKKQD
jgi:hypothetical protein